MNADEIVIDQPGSRRTASAYADAVNHGFVTDVDYAVLTKHDGITNHVWSLEEIVSLLDTRIELAACELRLGVPSGQAIGGVASILLVVWYVFCRIGLVRELARRAGLTRHREAKSRG